ncbi:MAG: hypothetical protein CM15mP77_3640 [Synechococcus sp.]|nr:MAG: hypothetical protein CM15mP77_3640 [Synechococcus sp.]
MEELKRRLTSWWTSCTTWRTPDRHRPKMAVTVVMIAMPSLLSADQRQTLPAKLPNWTIHQQSISRELVLETSTKPSVS